MAEARGDYRIRRRWPMWVVERRWRGGWDQIGLPMRHATAHAVFHELDDWQTRATLEARSVMRGELPRQVTIRQD